jgi:Helix-turn-helix
MIAGSVAPTHIIPTHVMLDDYYESLHGAYNSLRDTFSQSDLSQDELARRIGIDKSRVSRVLGGSENLTIKTFCRFGTGMGCRLVIMYVPYNQVQTETLPHNGMD